MQPRVRLMVPRGRKVKAIAATKGQKTQEIAIASPKLTAVELVAVVDKNTLIPPTVTEEVAP